MKTKGLKMKKTKLFLRIVLILAMLVGLTVLRGFLQKKNDEIEVKSSRQYAPEAPKGHPARLWYEGQEPDREILLACAADITADGLEDMIVIYQVKKNAVEAVALLAKEDGSYTVTPPIPAPVQHQKIRFFNMDREPELEFLITGDKNGAVGYAVFHILDGAIVDLFGEGMEDCC